MKKIKQILNPTLSVKKKSFLFILPVVLILFFIFKNFILPPGVISYGDNSFYYEKSFPTSWTPYFANGMSREMLVAPETGATLFTRSLLYSGFDYNTSSKIIFFLPIIISFAILFKLIYRLSKSYFLSFSGAVFFLLSGITIEYLLYFPIEYFWTAVSIIVLIPLLLKIYERSQIELHEIFLVSIVSLLNFHPFFLIVYLTALLFFSMIFLFDNFSSNNVAKIITIFFIVFSINLYWLLPFFISLFSGSSDPTSIYGSGNLKAVSNAYVSLSSLYRIILGSTYPIKYSSRLLINPSTIFFSFGLYLLFLVTVISNYKRKKVSKLIMIMFLLFLGLSFWPTNVLIKDLWDTLWTGVPSFQFFRSFNRFSIFLLPLMIFSIAVFYNKIADKKIINFLILALLTILIFGRKSLITGSFGGYIPIYEIPKEYMGLHKYLSEEGNKNSRLITYPKIDYEAYSWNQNINYVDFPQTFYLIELYLPGIAIQNKAASHLLSTIPFYKNLFNPVYCKDTEPLVRDFEKIDIDYVLLQKDLIDLEGKPVPYIEYKSCLDNSSFSLILSNEFFDFYKINHNSQFEKNYQIKETYPFYYQVDLDFKGKDSVEIVFPQNFNSGWKLYFDDSKDSGFIEKNAIPFYNKEIQVQHFDNEPGNKWVLNRNDFNDDNVTIHLYYYPQIYVVIGSVISLFSIITLVTIGVGLGIKSIKNKNVINIQ